MTKNARYVLLLIIFSYFFFIFGNGIVSLTNPDEVFYAQIAKEMQSRNSWMTQYMFDQPQFEKPIFLYWLMRIAFLVFGISSFSARFFPALFGALGVLVAYFLTRIAFGNEKKAFICALILMSGGLYFGLARTVFTDMVFSVFILFSLAAFFWGYSVPRRKGVSIILFFVFSALAVLSKGPLGFFIPFLVIAVFLAIRKETKYLSCASFFWGALAFIAISFPWYILMIKKYGGSFTQEFFYNCHIRRLIEAEHLMNDTWHFYPFSMIGCMFPWSIFVAASLFYLAKKIKRGKPVYLFLACWIAVVFLIFEPAHSKLVSYIFPMFPALAIACGDFFADALTEEKKKRKFFNLSLVTWFILLPLPIGALIASAKFPGYISSKFPVYLFVSLFVVWLILLLNFILRRSITKVIYLLALFIPLILAIIPLVKDDIEPYISSRDACAYLLKNYQVDGVIMSSKFFVRGTKYYSAKVVAAVDLPGKPFFSPHPIPFLDSDKEVIAFLRKQPVTYCLVKESNFEDLQRTKNFGLKMKLLKKIGNEYLLKIE